MSFLNLVEKYNTIRQTTLSLCEGLEKEDFVVQCDPDVSPIKWHLGHTTWFFEKLILRANSNQYIPFNENFDQIFNSYYQTFGQPWSRHRRGVLSRPTVEEVFAYRKYVDQKMQTFISKTLLSEDVLLCLRTGLEHEQQHQELMLMDIKFNFSCSPFDVLYRPQAKSFRPETSRNLNTSEKINIEAGVYDIGASGDRFAYDNEFPRHQVLLKDFSIENRLVSNRDYLDFINDGAYQNFTLWHADAWEQITSTKIEHPLYWRRRENQWFQYTLMGEQPIDLDEPVCHVNFYEASAFAEWSNKRLPTEFEWEIASRFSSSEKGLVTSDSDNNNCSDDCIDQGHFLESAYFHPQKITNHSTPLFGGLWEWTSSSYAPYPGYRRPQGTLQEYNSKFMVNQYVLRGGSFATAKEHIRPSYRNFYQPDKAWAFTGIRLAEDL